MAGEHECAARGCEFCRGRELARILEAAGGDVEVAEIVADTLELTRLAADVEGQPSH